MLGSVGGSVVSGWLSPTVLMSDSGVLMLVKGVAMTRRLPGPAAAPRAQRWFVACAQGLGVGFVTGRVGAGGGFLVVPTLVLFGAMPMRQAVGTSLFVIALNASAGLVGHLAHDHVDWTVGLQVTATAAMGALAGGGLARRVDSERMRRGFAVLVTLTGLWVLGREFPSEEVDAIVATRWPPVLGGLAVGGFVLLFQLVAWQPLGVSTGFTDCVLAVSDSKARRSSRLLFLGGILGAASWPRCWPAKDPSASPRAPSTP